MSSFIYENQNSKSFFNMAWIGFILSAMGMTVGIIYADVDLASKGFLIMSYLFSVSSCFTVAKVVRDRHEEDLYINKVDRKGT